MNAFVAALAGCCRADPGREKRLLAPTRRVGHQWLDAAARAGSPALNVRVETLRSLSVELAAPSMAAAGVTVAPRRAALLLVGEAVALLRPKRLRYLAGSSAGAGFAAAVLETLAALRLGGIPPGRLRRGLLEDDGKASDLKAILEMYLALLARRRLVDYAGVLELALERLGDEPDALGVGTLVLLPADLEREGLEARLLAALPSAGVREIPVDPPGWPAEMSFARAIGEGNEVRAVLRSCLERGVPLDEVEILHTDADTYVPLLLETFAALDRPGTAPEAEPPVTFAEGIPCDRSRPGRALAAWLRWTGTDCRQGALVAMVREGLLATGEPEGERTGFTRLAALLRALGIGFGRERYLPKIEARIEALEARLAAAEDAGEEDDAPEVAAARRERLTRDLAALRTLRGMVERLLALAPPDAAGAARIAAARDFLRTCARSADRFDGYALKSLIEQLDGMEHWIPDGDAGDADARAWLEALPTETRVLGSGPRPGRIHVDRMAGGGHSGRPNTFIVGLDEGRFPGAGLQDPLLLDRERARLPDLPTAARRAEEAVRRFHRLLGRLRGRVTLSWPCRDVVGDRDLFPSPLVLGAWRAASGNPAADPGELTARIPAASFAPGGPDAALDRGEWWLVRLTGEEVADAEAIVARWAPNLARGRAAAAARASGLFTPWDGHVPEAGAALDPASPTGRVLSAGGLETAGACPLRFFFRYALEIAPPEELVVDPEKWLDPLAKGSLLHELFEEFMRGLAAEERLPEARRDRRRLAALLQEKVAAARDTFPPPSEAVVRREREQLARIAETFLVEEERFCRESGSVPLYLEASLGMPPGGHATAIDSPEPVPVALPGGGAIRARGRIDRIDRVGRDYAIWDYKTGSDWGYDSAEPFVEGRKVQPYLYVRMVERRLREAVSPGARVRSSGYFFPGVKALGRRLAWPAERLAAGDEVLGLLCRLIASGAFIPTTDHTKDCEYCDYRALCGDVAAVAADSRRKVAAGEPLLEPVRELRGASLAKAAGREGEEE